ncbi:hypothetical protein C4561_05120 [candidate division WWE3 bacterium]|jgi:hypothetical protein|uniref:Uncharacterized protein n=1 Tax=candidate division WWE3 bacterium TaxID=2053526 RepID=A0A3A4ZIL1_UNCKA|nr:MAG: hypothetical protein C4561_05120 [candidate division WWE3 bacterium]
MPEPNELDGQTMRGLIHALAEQVRKWSGPMDFSRINKRSAKRAIGYLASQHISNSCWEYAWDSVGDQPGVVLIKGIGRHAVYAAATKSNQPLVEGGVSVMEPSYRVLDTTTPEERQAISDAVVLVITDAGRVLMDDLQRRVGDLIGYTVTGKRWGPIMKGIYRTGQVIRQGEYLVYQEPQEQPSKEAETGIQEPLTVSGTSPSIQGIRASFELSDTLEISRETPFEVEIEGALGHIVIPATKVTLRFKK